MWYCVVWDLASVFFLCSVMEHVGVSIGSFISYHLATCGEGGQRVNTYAQLTLHSGKQPSFGILSLFLHFAYDSLALKATSHVSSHGFAH